CGTKCAPGQVCSASKCSFSCAPGYTECVAPGSDAGPADASSDAPTDAGSGDTSSSGDTSGVDSGGFARHCANLKTDASNCGACGNVCKATEVCKSGSCKVACGTLTDCSGTCKDLTSDAKNCGACGNACASGDVCSASKCAATCDASLAKCGGKCTSTAYD